MPKVIALYLNPTKDLYQTLEVLRPGTVSHAESSGLMTAGKPVNAARSGAILGAGAEVLGFCGASELGQTQDDLKSAGLGAALFPIPGYSRTCVIVSEKSGRETVVNSVAGLRVGSKEIRVLGKTLRTRIKKGDWLMSCGSLPPGLPLREVASLIRLSRKRGAFFALDQRGPALLTLLKEKPDYVQANRSEYGQTFGAKARGERSILRLLDKVKSQGAGTAVFLDGAKGAYLSTAEGHWRLVPPRLRAQSTIGAGDAFLGGMLYGRGRDLDWPQSLRWAGAAAAANVMSPGACRFSRGLALKYYPLCEVKVVNPQARKDAR